MARSQTELTERLKGLDEDYEYMVYYQPPSKMLFPCIKFQRNNSWDSRADNILYFFMKRYSVTVIDRDPDSALPDKVEAMPFAAFDRFDLVDGLNHWVYNLYY